MKRHDDGNTFYTCGCWTCRLSDEVVVGHKITRRPEWS